MHCIWQSVCKWTVLLPSAYSLGKFEFLWGRLWKYPEDTANFRDDFHLQVLLLKQPFLELSSPVMRGASAHFRHFYVSTWQLFFFLPAYP